jgi:acyl carrier protein
MTTTLSELRLLLARVLETPAEAITPQTSIRRLPNSDSMRMLGLTVDIEDHFQVEVPDAVVQHLETVAELSDLIDGLRQRRCQ